MREIKFRVFDKVTKQYIKDLSNFWIDPHNFKTYMEIHPELDGETVFEDTDFIFDQYTGLKDTEGKEIYEGDLLSRGEGYRDVEVEFRSGCFWCGLLPLYQEVRHLKVVGNIHENKGSTVSHSQSRR